jgi:hypothetical protein
MTKLYQLWITIKYQYYKLYWKISPPKQKRSKFYGWHEVSYDVLDQKAIGIGVIKGGNIND